MFCWDQAELYFTECVIDQGFAESAKDIEKN